MKQRMMWIHGWGMSPAAWQGLQKSLPEYEHHMIDFGSCDTPESFRYALASALTAESNQDGERRWNLVGWSMGGMLALDVMLTDGLAPQMNKILLMGATLRFTEKDRQLGWPPRILERMKKRLPEYQEETLAEFRRGCLSAAELAEYTDRNLPLQNIIPDCSTQGLIAGLDYLRDTDLSHHVDEIVKQEHISLPDMLWIHGDQDKICPVGGLATVSSWVESGILQKIILPGAGHIPFITQQQKVTELMKEFYGND